MAYLNPYELETHLRGENLLSIAREDETLILSAISTAVAEAKGYLAAYDRERIFRSEGDSRDPLLLNMVKDIAVWHIIKVCNGGVDMEYRQGLYERAIKWLEHVQQGRISPDLPKTDLDKDGKPDQQAFYLYGSNPKRRQHF